MEECYAKSQLEYNFYLGVELLTKSWPSLLFRIGTLYKELSTELLIYYFVYIDDIYWWQGIYIHPSSNYMIFMGTWISNSINNNIIIIYFLFHQFSYLLVWQDIFYFFIIQTYISDEENVYESAIFFIRGEQNGNWTNKTWICINFFPIRP